MYPSSLPNIDLQVLPTFPAHVGVTGVLTLVKSGLSYTFGVNFQNVSEETNVSDMSKREVLVQDTDTGAFWRVKLSNMPTGQTDWANIQNKPATFPPSPHTHPVAEISDATPLGQALVTAVNDAAARGLLGGTTIGSAVFTAPDEATAQAALDVPPNTRTISAGTGLTGGGDLSTDRTISVAVNGITNSLLAQAPANTLKGNPAGSPADVQDVTLGSTLAFSGTALQTGAGTGDVTWSANSFATTISNNAVDNAKLADMAAATVKGRAAGGGTGDPQDLTVSQILDMITSTRGSILYRGASGWAALPPGTSGQVLATFGAGADPAWSTAAGAGVFTLAYESTPQTWANNGAVTVTHGLGTEPKFVYVLVECVTAQLGWSVGDKIVISSYGNTIPGEGHFGCAICANSTNVVVRVAANGIRVVNNNDGTASTALTPSSWRIIVRAYA